MSILKSIFSGTYNGVTASWFACAVAPDVTATDSDSLKSTMTEPRHYHLIRLRSAIESDASKKSNVFVSHCDQLSTLPWIQLIRTTTLIKQEPETLQFEPNPWKWSAPKLFTASWTLHLHREFFCVPSLPLSQSSERCSKKNSVGDMSNSAYESLCLRMSHCLQMLYYK